MLSKSSLFPGAILVAAIFVSGCNDTTPSGPSTLPSVTPSAAPEQSGVVGVVATWNLTVRVTESRGKGCVADSLLAEINTHNQYSLSIVQKGNATDATLASASGDYACTFPVLVENSGFTEGPGYYSCGRERRVVGCDGTQHALATFGQTISGRFTNNDVSGVWSADWMDLTDDEHDVEMKAQFTGSR
jgi:hypothetical protein